MNIFSQLGDACYLLSPNSNASGLSYCFRWRLVPAKTIKCQKIIPRKNSLLFETWFLFCKVFNFLNELTFLSIDKVYLLKGRRVAPYFKRFLLLIIRAEVNAPVSPYQS